MRNYYNYAIASVFLFALAVIGASLKSLEGDTLNVSEIAAISAASAATQGGVKAINVLKTDYIPSLQSPAVLPDPKNPDVLVLTFATGVGKFHLSTKTFEFKEEHYVDPAKNTPQSSKSNNKYPLSPEQTAYFEILTKGDSSFDSNTARAVGSLVYSPMRFATGCDVKLIDSDMKKVIVESMLEKGVSLGMSSTTLKSSLCHVAPDPHHNRVIFYGNAFGQVGGDVSAGIAILYNNPERMVVYPFEEMFSKFPAHESRVIGVTHGHVILNSKTGLYDYDSRSKTTKKINNFKVSTHPDPLVLDGKLIGFNQRNCLLGCGPASNTLDIKVLDIEKGVLLASSTMNGVWWLGVGSSINQIFVGVTKPKSSIGMAFNPAQPPEGLDLFRFDVATSAFIPVKLDDVRNKVNAQSYDYGTNSTTFHLGEWTVSIKDAKDEPFKLYVTQNAGPTTTLEIRGVEKKSLDGHLYAGLRGQQSAHSPYWFDVDNKNVLWLAFQEKITRVDLRSMTYRVYSVPNLDTGMTWANIFIAGNQFDVVAAGDVLVTEDFSDGVRVYRATH